MLKEHEDYTKEHVCTAYKYPRKAKPRATADRPTMHLRPILAALASLVRLRVHARRHEDVVARGRLDRVRGLLERLAGYDAVDV